MLSEEDSAELNNNNNTNSTLSQHPSSRLALRNNEPILKFLFEYLNAKTSNSYCDDKFCQTEGEFNSQSLNQKLALIETSVKSKFEQCVPN